MGAFPEKYRKERQSMKKRILAAALCAATVLSLTGCGKEEAPANTNSSTVSTTSSAENTSTSTPASTASTSTSTTASTPASAPTSSSENDSTASSDPASDVTESKPEESGDIIQEVADILGVEYDESSSKLVEEFNYQVLTFAELFNNHLGLVRPGTWGTILYDTLDSIITGEYVSSLDPSKDPSLDYTTEELQNHLRYCMFYGFEYLEEPSLQLPSTVYQNLLKYSVKKDGVYFVPFFLLESVKDITIVKEIKDFGDGIQSQLTMTVVEAVEDGENITNVYFTVLSDEKGKHFKFLDFD